MRVCMCVFNQICEDVCSPFCRSKTTLKSTISSRFWGFNKAKFIVIPRASDMDI